MTRRPIVHPTDFSVASRAAFATALELAKAAKAPLLLMHVLNPAMPMMTARPVSPPTLEGYRQAVWAEATGELRRLVQRARRAGVRAETLVREGAEAPEIARAARSHRAAMIVMGTHGRTGFRKLMVGSVATRVLGVAPCPVLTVRERAPLRAARARET